MFRLLVSLLALAQPPAAPDAGPILWVQDGRIVQVSERPPLSGVVAFYAHIDVAQPGGAPQRFYLLWMSQHQYLPAVGAVCTIGYRREPLLPGNGHRHDGRREQRDVGLHNVILELGCGRATNPAPVG